MASNPFLEWLENEPLKTNVAKRFAAFCQEDFVEQEKKGNVDAEIYEEAAKRILDQFESIKRSDT